MKESGRWELSNLRGTLDPEVAERWWEKVEHVMNLVGCTPENRLKYIVSLFVGNALIWWRSLKRAYEPREITWAEFQRDFDDKYRPKMYRDKKRMEFLNLVQGDEQTMAEYALRFAALAKYAPEAVATQEDRCYRFEQGLRPEIKRGLAVRIINFKTLVESTVRMEEAEVGTFRVVVLVFEEVAGQHLVEEWVLIGSIDRSSSTMPSIGSGKGVGQGYSRGTISTPNCSIYGRRHLGQCWGPSAIPRICYNCGGRGHMSRDCRNQTMSLVRSAGSGTQSQNSVGSSGRGADRSRGRGRGRGIGNRDANHPVSVGMRGSGAQVTQGQTQARIYNMTREEAPASNGVISGTILLFDVEAYVLIDPGSTHSYISSELAFKIPGKNSPLGYNLMVYLPVGGGVVVNSVRKGSIVRIGDVNLPVDLIVMDLKEFDVIFGMDWLAQ
ncbi:UNVERIFIED_CONTAM: hypothetical protein Scaly_0597200 [Sesamum calycinum]|uniref:CCHC-type domain-containing protein n=1 Tax=Sesamum calycinum TaxID=2727403 RepID=A0AAW2RSI1_9LAMI